MTAQSNVNVEMCGEWKLNSRSLQDRWRCRCTHLLLKYSRIFAHTDKSNTSFKSVKTLRLFLCTQNNNKTLCFCKIMKANRMRFLASQSPWTWARNSVYICLTDMKKYIYRERNVNFQINQFKWKTNILRLCNLYETCRQAHPLLHRWRVSVADFIS